MEKMTTEYIWDLWTKIQAERPLVHCITNIVTVNDCANILLAAGASPTMAHHPSEVEEVTAGCRSLVLNLGATESVEAMKRAARKASELGHPIVIDPVGVSGSSWRRELCAQVMREAAGTFSCIRGNLSEIKALAANQGTAVGVDAAQSDRMQAQTLQEAADTVRELAAGTGAIVIASGQTDLVSDGKCVYAVRNGSPLMARITGSGCMSSALLGAFLSAEQSLEAAAASCVVMGIAGELAEQRTRQQKGGTGTFRTCLLDAVSMLEKNQLEKAIVV